MGPLVTKGSDLRITKIGRFLRKSKLDELPQLFNVLKGDMSIVGPRPEVEKYAFLFKEKYKSVLSIRPGITDYATLEYRDEQEVLNQFADTEEGYIKEVLPAKIALYEKYLGEMSFATDLKIIVKTLQRILS
jgi:lipopolysaccharide/colanic/teichoic acid biosynthesis glycosyltransferase